MNSFRNVEHGYGVSVKAHGPLWFIHIRVLHYKNSGIPNHHGASIPKNMKREKLKIVSRVVHGKPTLLTTTKGGHG